MTEKTIRELTLEAIDQALAETIRRQFISMALTDPTDDGGVPLALKRFKRGLPQLADLISRQTAHQQLITGLAARYRLVGLYVYRPQR